MKRVVVISDLHCGHLVGLTHPDFDARPNNVESSSFTLYNKRSLYWRLFSESIAQLQPIDYLIVNGDAIDGRGEKSGSTELLVVDRNEQVQMAIAVIETVKARKVVMSYGTAYHNGKLEDYEQQIANAINAVELVPYGYVDVEGLVLNYRHHCGGSSVPYGRVTSIAKERLWDVLRSEYDEFPKSDIVIRSHTHYFSFGGGYRWLAMVTPALQGYGSKYGERRVTGSIDWGFVHFDIESKEEYSWTQHIVKPKQLRITPTRL